MKKLLLALAVLTITATAMAREIVNQVAAVVNDQVITLYEIESMSQPLIAKLLQDNPNLTPPERNQRADKIKQKVLRGMIENKLIESEVKRLGIEVTDGEVDEYADQIKKANNFTDETLKLNLVQQGLTMEEFRERLKLEIMRDQYIRFRIRDKLRIRDEDIQSYYDNNKSEFAAEPVVTIAEIRLNIPPEATELQAQEVFTKANEIYEKLLGGADFGQMVRAHSQGSTAADGGILGPFKLNSELKPLYSKAVSVLNVGQMSTIYRDQNGFFILKLLEKNESGVVPLEQVKDKIEMILHKKMVDIEMQRLAAELYKKSFVDIRVKFSEE